MSSEESSILTNRQRRADSFDKFTEAARQSLAFAQEEARYFKQSYIGTEHLLLGLLRDDQTVAGRALSELGVTIESGHKALSFINPTTDDARNLTGDVGLTLRAKKALELGVQEAGEFGEHFIGTEHILLGIVREGQGLGAAMLVHMGIALDRVRAQVLRVRETKGATTESPSPGTRNNVVSFRLDDRAMAALDSLVEAGVRNTRSEAAAWLIEAGITAKQEFFQQVDATVAQIRALRSQVQSLAKQASAEKSPQVAPADESQAPPDA